MSDDLREVGFLSPSIRFEAMRRVVEAAELVVQWYFDDRTPGQGLEKMKALQRALEALEGQEEKP